MRNVEQTVDVIMARLNEATNAQVRNHTKHATESQYGELNDLYPGDKSLCVECDDGYNLVNRRCEGD